MFNDPWVVFAALVIGAIIYTIYAYLNRNNQDWYWNRKRSMERVEKEKWLRDFVKEVQRLR